MKNSHELINTVDTKTTKDTLSSNIWFHKANLMLFSEQYPKAVDYYLQALQLDLQNGEAWYNLGCTMHKLKFYKNAVFCFDQTLQNVPNHIDASINSGHAYFMLGKYNTALCFFKKGMILSPDDFETITNLGVTYEKLKDYNNAILCFERALQIKSDYEPAKACKIRVLQLLKLQDNKVKKTSGEAIIICNISTSQLLSQLISGWHNYQAEQSKHSLTAKPILKHSKNTLSLSNADESATATLNPVPIKPQNQLNITTLINQYTDPSSTNFHENRPN